MKFLELSQLARSVRELGVSQGSVLCWTTADPHETLRAPQLQQEGLQQSLRVPNGHHMGCLVPLVAWLQRSDPLGPPARCSAVACTDSTPSWTMWMLGSTLWRATWRHTHVRHTQQLARGAATHAELQNRVVAGQCPANCCWHTMPCL